MAGAACPSWAGLGPRPRALWGRFAPPQPRGCNQVSQNHERLFRRMGRCRTAWRSKPTFMASSQTRGTREGPRPGMSRTEFPGKVFQEGTVASARPDVNHGRIQRRICWFRRSPVRSIRSRGAVASAVPLMTSHCRRVGSASVPAPRLDALISPTWRRAKVCQRFSSSEKPAIL